MCLAHLPTHRLLLPGMPFLPTSICPPQPTCPALVVAFCESCLTRSVPSVCPGPSRLIIDCRDPFRRFDTWPTTRSRRTNSPWEHWSTGSHNARCQNGPPRLIPLPDSPNLDSDPVSLPSTPLCLLPPSNTGPVDGRVCPSSRCPIPCRDPLQDTAASNEGRHATPSALPPPPFAPPWQQ